eukprot:1136555-Pelagomonas_calceolata.AAC.1
MVISNDVSARGVLKGGVIMHVGLPMSPRLRDCQLGWLNIFNVYANIATWFGSAYPEPHQGSMTCDSKFGMKQLLFGKASNQSYKATELVLKLRAFSVRYAYQLASTRQALEKASFNSHHRDEASGTASNPPDPN